MGVETAVINENLAVSEKTCDACSAYVRKIFENLTYEVNSNEQRREKITDVLSRTGRCKQVSSEGYCCHQSYGAFIDIIRKLFEGMLISLEQKA